MDDDTTRQSVLFSDLFAKRLVARFDQRAAEPAALHRRAPGVRIDLWSRPIPPRPTVPGGPPAVFPGRGGPSIPPRIA